MKQLIEYIKKRLLVEYGFNDELQNSLFNIVEKNNDLYLQFKGVPTECQLTAIQEVFDTEMTPDVIITFNHGKANQRIIDHNLCGCNNADCYESIFDIAVDRLRNGLTNGNILTVNIIDEGFVPPIYFCDELAKRGISFEEQNYLFSSIENHEGAWTVTLKTTINKQYILRILQTLDVVCEWYGDYVNKIHLNILGQICPFEVEDLKKILLG